MRAETVSIVNDLKRVSVEQIVNEAISNSIQAGANQIEVSLNTLDHDAFDDHAQYVSEIEVVDDGHGFKPEDLTSFQTYRSHHKKAKFGAKGVGRFLFLKMFKDVEIHSLDKVISFNIDNDVVISNSDKYNENTHLKIKSPVTKTDYQVNKSSFVNGIKLHFLPNFKLINNYNNRVVSIAVKFNGVIFTTIKSDEIPNFKENKFTVGKHEFQISYLLDDPDFRSDNGAYCADNRVVITNSQLEADKKFKAFKGVDFFFLLSSEYFKKNVNDERDDLTIKAKQKSTKDMFGSLSWEDIHIGLANKIKQICLENGIDISQQADEYLKRAVDKAPFLSNYFEDNDLMLPEEDLLKQAQKLFNEDKEKIRGNKGNISSSERSVLLNKVVQAELAEYVFDRQHTIEKLKLLEEQNALEKEIHNLFVEQCSSGTSDYRTSNLWLFDDRFMSYDKVFSDKQIQQIFPELYKNLDKPDILTISSNTFDKSEITDVVIIELKRPEAKNDVAIAESELLKYSRYTRESGLSNIRIWTYAFISFDEDSDLALDDKSYNKIPVQNGWPIRYRFHDRLNTIINFIDYKALAFDAEARNNTFLNILKAKHYQEGDDGA